MEREQDTGISILIVGGGIAGLTFAIEAHRKGHNVQVIERRLRGETAGKHHLQLLCILTQCTKRWTTTVMLYILAD
jgi:glycine/D-amino acid oxidase-like deaminating enzyme